MPMAPANIDLISPYFIFYLLPIAKAIRTKRLLMIPLPDSRAGGVGDQAWRVQISRIKLSPVENIRFGTNNCPELKTTS
jgi:hypothetical protein